MKQPPHQKRIPEICADAVFRNIEKTGIPQVGIQAHHRDPPVMVAPDEKVSPLGVYLHVAAPHTADPLLVDLRQVPVFINREGGHTLVRDGIEELSVL